MSAACLLKPSCLLVENGACYIRHLPPFISFPLERRGLGAILGTSSAWVELQWCFFLAAVQEPRNIYVRWSFIVPAENTLGISCRVVE